jgi:hypothetical protein
MVLDDPSQLDTVMEAWVGAGVPGITVLESTGIHRVLTRTGAHPAFAGFSQLLQSGRVGHNTLFAVIDSLDTAAAAASATEAILGNLNRPHTGLIFAVPVARTWGVPEPYADAASGADD